MTPRMSGITSSNSNTAASRNSTPALLKNELHAFCSVVLVMESQLDTACMFANSMMAMYPINTMTAILIIWFGSINALRVFGICTRLAMKASMMLFACIELVTMQII